MGRVGRPRTDDTDDIRKVAEILEAGGVTFRQACRTVYEGVGRQETFENFCARLYTKRDREILPLVGVSDHAPDEGDLDDEMGADPEDPGETPSPPKFRF